MSETRAEGLAAELVAARQKVLDLEIKLGQTTPSDLQNLFVNSIEQLHEGIQIIDRQWRYLYLNDAAAKHGRFAKKDLLGKLMYEVYPEIRRTSMFELIEQVMIDRVPRRMENLFEHSDEDKVWFDLFVEPHNHGILIRSIDINARKKIEESYLYAQKMEAVGQLAGGIAHDFNNKLGIMLIFAEMSLDALTNKNPVPEQYLVNVIEAVNQSAILTKQLLAFSRKQVFDLRVVELNELIDEAKAALVQLLGEKINVQFFLDTQLGHVRIDPSQMQQILLNLCNNAREATEKSGTVTIETANVKLTAEDRSEYAGIVPGNYAMISVSDTGRGMTAEVRQRIFEPFFSTKGIGKAAGLGLSTVHGIVNQSGGHIWVYSEPGRGSVFKMFFPVIPEEKDERDDSRDPVIDLSGNERVLLVEDDLLLQIAYAQALVSAGYRVKTSRNAEDAVKLYESHGGEFDLLMTDVILPNADGGELARNLQRLDPKLKVIYVSGYTENSLAHHANLDASSVIVQKPTSTKNLLTALRKVLDGKMARGVL